MKCKSDASKQDIDTMFAALEALTESIPGILAFEGGENTSPENINRGYTHGFTMDFANEQVREIYLPHPEHKKAQIPMQEVLADDADSVLVVDFPIKNTEAYDLYQTS
jgi:hypothetical protein